MSSSISNPEIQFLSNKEILKFQELFPQVTSDALGTVDMTELPSFVKTYYSQLWVNNIPHGKKIRAEILILSYKFFAYDLSDENMRLSHILGWIVEIIHSASLIGHGFKSSPTSSNTQQSYSGLDIVDLSAVNDMIFMENAAFLLTKKYFEDKPYYKDLMALFHDSTLKTSLGQRVDLMTKIMDESYNSCKFNSNVYKVVVNHKSYSSVYLPVALAMIMADAYSEKTSIAIKDISLQIGAYYEAQSDFLDAFASEDNIEITSTAIAQGKYTWPIVTAFERGNALHRKMLLENYGQSETFKICVVKTIFERLDIKNLYWTFEYESRQKINTDIENLPMGIPKPLFQLLMAAFYARWP